MLPTTEQSKIIEAVKDGKSILINAAAGAAKTTTLLMIAESVPKSALYLTFNKVMSEEAKEKFPEYVDVSTWHSLAYRECGYKLKHKLRRPKGAYKNVLSTGGEIAREFKLKNLVFGDKYLSAAALGYAIKQTLARFEYSDDYVIKNKHISHDVISKFSKNGEIIKSFPLEEYNNIVLSGAIKLWKKRIDPEDDTIIAHDTYLKLFQLSNPIFDQYDIIYSDESQDSSDVMIDILKKQSGCQVVVVGDKNQQIYAFRGSVNAMGKFPHLDTYSLTKSFRFGESVGDVASVVTGSEVNGWEELSTEVVTHVKEVDPMGSTFIYRTNMALLFDACEFISKGYSVNIENDVKRLGSILQSALALRSGNKRFVKAEELSPYNNWEEFEEDCKNQKGELNQILNIVRSGRAMEVIGIASSYKKSASPDIIMTTAHKSKGMEWDRVILAEDFPEPEVGDDGAIILKGEERNLLYVALTRGKRLLKLNTLAESLVGERGMSLEGAAQ